jgi:hypothetical protein
MWIARSKENVRSLVVERLYGMLNRMPSRAEVKAILRNHPHAQKWKDGYPIDFSQEDCRQAIAGSSVNNLTPFGESTHLSVRASC